MGKQKLAASVCVAIDPDNCGSSVMGYVYKATSYKSYENRRSVRSGGKVILTDCGRSITWDIDDGQEGVAKLNNAIKALTALRDAARRELPKARALHKEVAAHNRALKRKRGRVIPLEDILD